MAEESGLKPALTAEEWNQVSPSAIGFLIEEQVSRDAMHMVAALALHGQPFGFTREMVKGIRQCADFTDGPEAELARQAADRIEALLPPEKS